MRRAKNLCPRGDYEGPVTFSPANSSGTIPAAVQVSLVAWWLSPDSNCVASPCPAIAFRHQPLNRSRFHSGSFADDAHRAVPNLAALLSGLRVRAFCGNKSAHGGFNRPWVPYPWRSLTAPVQSRQSSTPVISNTGVVAFGASVDDGGRAVFALQDGVLTLIGDNARFPDFNPPSISGNGTVVLCVREANSGPGISIVAWQSGELSEVVSRADGPFSDLNTSPAINNRDYVVFWGRLAGGGDVIAGKQIGDEGPIEVLGPGVIPDQAPALNASNTAAFVGSPAIIGGNAIFTTGSKGPPYAGK